MVKQSTRIGLESKHKQELPIGMRLNLENTGVRLDLD